MEFLFDRGSLPPVKTILISLTIAALCAALFFLARHYNDRPENHLPSMKKTPNSAFKNTPLHDAAKNGDMEACQKLVADGADINALDESEWSPLVHAVQGDHLSIARFLLGNGAQMQYHYQREDTPEERDKQKKEHERMNSKINLSESMKDTFKDLPEDILKDLTSEETMRDLTQDMVNLHFEPSTVNAIEYCTSLDMLKMLVMGFKANVNFVAGDGYWPLSSFAETDDLDAVKWLLENGADPNNTSTGETAIFKAIRNDNLDMVKLFVQKGAKVDVEDVDGWSVLFPCTSIEMATYLISQGADPTSLDQAGFPCWNWVDDPATKAYLKDEAQKRGLKRWTELPN